MAQWNTRLIKRVQPERNPLKVTNPMLYAKIKQIQEGLERKVEKDEWWFQYAKSDCSTFSDDSDLFASFEDTHSVWDDGEVLLNEIDLERDLDERGKNFGLLH